MRTDKRIVKYTIQKPEGKKPGLGYFHKWLPHNSLSAVAVIEAQDGKVEVVPSYDIQFIEFQMVPNYAKTGSK
jgi:hypothetical protein